MPISYKNKVVTLPVLLKKTAILRRSRRMIAFTNGCFDLMHVGHVTYLEAAKNGKKGDNRILIVGLNSDKSVVTIKDPGRPICPQQSRAAVLASLACVDFVVLFNEETPYNLIKAIQPDVLIKGADYKNKEVVGSDIVKARKGKVELIKFVNGFSTSNIITKITKHYGNKKMGTGTN
jgi:rfaE bifunctional protein nucleotidyltransferase chain/domain